MRTLQLLLMALLLSGCAIKPWLKPYERARLADPVMNVSANPIAEQYIDHVHEARESMRGAEGSAGGGCGCS
ncbi:lipoprotein [Alcanivorax hongdengensis A-11-3]|uniref:Lipoprotein n=1 Tax=Alcanivorax hongdengensis A-11-3 TaxID=1177179 RepID=L0WJ08_9GAMM|nr:DUF4266 domain-containing protein [Alcanivorax hongdengensis]EKF75830.1 lipoprotein [Alcanivorax hongdengensis A-11-3]